jgi:chorismate mutase
MTDMPPGLVRRRARIDRLNLRLRDLLQQRARLAADIARWKRTAGFPVEDRTRERYMLDTLLAEPGPGFDRATLRRLLQSIFAASRRHAVREAARSGNAGRRRRKTSHER